MTEQLELVLLMAFVVSVTALLISGMVLLALRLAAPRAARDRTNGTETPLGPWREVMNDQDTSTRAGEASSAKRRKWNS
ncbi:MAG TPA: hypothetical protein VIT65_14225 [Microlunatus sp.]|jgi:hypothetical protein